MQRSVHFDFSPSQPKIPVPSPQRAENTFKRNVTYYEHSGDLSVEKKKPAIIDIVKGTNVMKVNRKQMKDIQDWVETSLLIERDAKSGRKQSQTNSEIEVFKKQIDVLSIAMEKLVIVTKEHCIEQADLMDRLWKSAFELHDRLHKLTNSAINELRCEQMDNVLSIRKLKHQVKLVKLQQELGSTKSTRSQQVSYDEQPSSEESRAEVAALTAELLLKDQELLGLHQTISQLSIWFPHFPVYSQSLLSKLLPPVKNSDQLSIESSQITPDKMLLQDLRRLEGIGLGFKVMNPEDMIAEQAMSQTNRDRGAPDLEDDSITKLSMASSNNSILLEPHLPKLPAYESLGSTENLTQNNYNDIAMMSLNASNQEQLQPSIVTIDNLSRSNSLGEASFVQSVVNGNESFKVLLTISLEQEQKIIALTKELDGMKSTREAEVATLQAEIDHLNAALTIQQRKSSSRKPGNDNNNNHSIDMLDSHEDVTTKNYINMLSFVRRKSVDSVASIQSPRKENSNSISVPKNSVRMMAISQVHGYLIDFMRFTTTHPDRRFHGIFGTGSLDSRTSVATLSPTLPTNANAFLFENKVLRSITTWNSYVIIRLSKYFCLEFEDCIRGQAMTERFLLSLLHIFREVPALPLHYHHFLSELFGIPNKISSSDSAGNVYSLKNKWQGDLRSYLYCSLFEESFKAMQAFIGNKEEAGQSNFPLPMTCRILHRIFDVSNSSFDSSSSFEPSNHGSKWWLCVTSRLLNDLKMRVEMSAFNDDNNNCTGIPMVNCYSCLHFCWQYVQLLHSLWSNILAGVYTYLVSVIPSNASSQQFHLLLASILEHPNLFSSLSTSPHRKLGDGSNGSDPTKGVDNSSDTNGALLSPSQPSLSKSLHEPDPPTVNATLMDELMSLAAADNLDKDSFADAIIRSNSSTLVRSLGHLIDPYYSTTVEEATSLWNAYEKDVHLEGRLLMAELQSLCEEQGALAGVSNTEGDTINKNSHEYKIHKLNVSCRRQLHLPADLSTQTQTAQLSLNPFSGSKADLSTQFSEPSFNSGTSKADSSIYSNTWSAAAKNTTLQEVKAVKMRRSYFKESVLTSKVLYPKEVDVPVMSTGVHPSEEEGDHNFNHHDAQSEPEADMLQVEYFSQVLSFAERILLHARQCFNPHFVKVKKPSKLDVTLTLMTMRYYIGVSRKLKVAMGTRNGGAAAEQNSGALSPTRRGSAYTASADFNVTSNHPSISLLSSLVVGNHVDWYKHQKAVFFGRKKTMSIHFRAWANYSVAQFSKDD